MYHHILVPLENSSTDDVALSHVTELAQRDRARIFLIHVAHGHVARNQKALHLAPSEEMRTGRAYLKKCRDQLVAKGLNVSMHLALGEPSEKILAYSKKIGCDLIVMGTHGHRLLADLVLGSVAREVRHATHIPVLLIRDTHSR